MADLYSLLARGYFPPKLPAPFSTEKFARILSSNISNLPTEFNNHRITARLAHHSVARIGMKRRKISIPNPILQYRLFGNIAEYWEELIKCASQGSISLSKPKLGQIKNRAIEMEHRFDDLPRNRLRIRSTSRYILKADIASCYPSIYTHTIPWALHGKDLAKKNRSHSLFGNLLDTHVRNAQDQETVGLPIGPDSSYLLAEAILSNIDREFIRAIGKINGLRYSDDYELGFRTESEAQSAHSILEALLHEFKLKLNFDKTNIYPLPRPIDSTWVPKLRTYEFRKLPRGQATDYLAYFDLAFQLSAEHPNDHVLNYAVARLSPRSDPDEMIHKDNWSILQNFLFQCLMVESGTFLKVIELLIQYHKLGFDIDLASIGDLLNHLIPQLCELGHGSELAWAIWCMIFFGIPIEAKPSKALSSVKDCVVAILALDANDRGLFPNGLDTSIWQQVMNEDNLYSEYWLLSYEANIKGWSVPLGKKDYVDADPCFGYMKKQGIHFYESDKMPLNVPAGTDIDDDIIAPLIIDYFY